MRSSEMERPRLGTPSLKLCRKDLRAHGPILEEVDGLQPPQEILFLLRTSKVSLSIQDIPLKAYR